MNEQRKIKKLDEAVINRIAAGEIIQRPANALKELIENSLDAKSTNIQITVKDGGLKLLQIQDNGSGINKDDMDIVCERFTTSKLQEFEDLQKISTYGFRGEALASISHIAHLTITSKTKSDICAYQAHYVDSKLNGKPKTIAGNQGTIITVEDLFYNMSVRRTVLRSPAEEYQKISDVVGKYAVHNSKTGFALKKSNEGNDIRTQPNSTAIDNIRCIYGNTIAKELLELKVENREFNFTAAGLISNANYNTKKYNFLLFINHRLVDCQNLKKSVDQVYSTYLPKNTHPFVYLSLELDPNTIDVNVHPTKHEVHFLNEEQIIEVIVSELETKLLGSNNSRAFYVQSKLPGVVIESKESLAVADKTVNKSINPKDFVRTDSGIQKLEKFFGAPTFTCRSSNSQESMVIEDNHVTKPKKNIENKCKIVEDSKNKQTASVDDSLDANMSICSEDFSRMNEEFLQKNNQFEIDLLNKTVDKMEEDFVPPERPAKPKKDKIPSMSKVNRVNTELTSILDLRKEIEEKSNKSLRETFAQHVFVGSIDPNQSLIQFSTKLYLCNTRKILEELFYQFVLFNFQNFEKLVFENEMSVYELALLALEQPECGWTEEDGEKKELAQSVSDILSKKAEMLQVYFSLEIDKKNNLKSIPILLDNYVPDLKELPMYILRLATEVNWKEERECFGNFARETARFYANVPDQTDELNRDWKWITEHVIYPAIKDYFIPPKNFTENSAILEIANLPNLYKVFERC